MSAPIFYKPISQAVREGELSSYIQSQRAIIRVEPSEWMLSDEFKQASEAEQIKHRKHLRQKTWNEYATTIFRDGVDERTGDLLTENQAGFFVDGIAQANHLQKLLNNDEELQRRAVLNGCEGVAVAIHSRLTRSEQIRRLEAYQRGDYLAVIGDEKFKEGFDHPPMKTIIDYPHSSVVDKAQILGRGARKWWNDKKGRFEGLTVIDTVIYIGSPDKDENTVNRDTALYYSVSVKEILEESYVLGPEAPHSPLKLKLGGENVGGYGIEELIDDPHIEYYSKIEDLYSIEAEIGHLRKEHWIDLSDEMHTQLVSEVERTGIGYVSFFDSIDDLPDGLNSNILRSWYRRSTITVDKNLWEYVINHYSNLHDGGEKVENDDDMH